MWLRLSCYFIVMVIFNHYSLFYVHHSFSRGLCLIIFSFKIFHHRIEQFSFYNLLIINICEFSLFIKYIFTLLLFKDSSFSLAFNTLNFLLKNLIWDLVLFSFLLYYHFLLFVYILLTLVLKLILLPVYTYFTMQFLIAWEK